MDSLKITLPAVVQRLLEEKVALGGFASPDEYVCHLIEMDHTPEVLDDQTQRLLIEGVRSGAGEPITDAYWDQMLDRLKQKHARRSAVP